MSKKSKRKVKITRVLPELMNVYRYFGTDIKRKSGLIASSFVALFFGVIFRLLEPWPLKFVLDEVFKKGETTAANSITLPETWTINGIVIFVAVSVVVIAAMRATMDYISKVGFFKVGNYIVIRVRDRVYRHLQALPMKFHDRAKHGDLITRVTRDVSLLRDVTATAILPLLGSSMVLIGMAAVMIWMNWKLAAISLIIIPLYWLTTVRLGRQIRQTARKQREREGAMATIASQAISSIRAIKSLGLEAKFASDFDKKNNQSQTEDLKASRLSLRLGRTVDILLAVATALVLWTGAHFVLGNSMYPGDLVVFLIYLKRSFKPAQEFAKYVARIAKATAAGERVINLLERPVEPERKDGITLEHVNGEIEFENVTFGYDDRQLILKEFSLKIPAGKTFAIAGPSGIGKSTLLSLLLGFYKPKSGRILIDGIDIRKCTLESLRSNFSMVLQDPILFAASIHDNIAFAIDDVENMKEKDVTRNVITAARFAEVDEFVTLMPDGYNSQIGERSTTLSTGQRQRIAIARAAAANKAMLLLDEPTAALDEHNREIVTLALLELAQKKTTLVITHNLQLASRADEIVYVADGRVKQQGKHSDLLALGGEYADLFSQQASQTGTGGPL